jgi:hypothetical protein|tara:strand:- start:5334 stop:5693 length:360 start_codon:yes stop_codon:yes gene_type:complete
MDRTWKAFERRVAERTGGERIPVADRRSHLDVLHPVLGIECKYRRKISKFLKDALDQAIEGSKEESLFPVVVLGEKYSTKMYAFMDLQDLLRVLAVVAVYTDNPPTILVGEGEDDHAKN